MWSTQDQVLYWIDIVSKRLFRYHHSSGQVDTRDLPYSPSALIPRAQGGLLLITSSMSLNSTACHCPCLTLPRRSSTTPNATVLGDFGSEPEISMSRTPRVVYSGWTPTSRCKSSEAIWSSPTAWLGPHRERPFIMWTLGRVASMPMTLNPSRAHSPIHGFFAITLQRGPSPSPTDVPPTPKEDCGLPRWGTGTSGATAQKVNWTGK